MAGDMTPNRDQLEELLLYLAEMVAGPGGEVYTPLFERIEREISQLDRQLETKARAEALLRRAREA